MEQAGRIEPDRLGAYATADQIHDSGRARKQVNGIRHKNGLRLDDLVGTI